MFSVVSTRHKNIIGFMDFTKFSENQRIFITRVFELISDLQSTLQLRDHELKDIL